MMMARFGGRLPRRQEGRDRSRHRSGPGDRADVPRADRRAVSRSRGARRGDWAASAGGSDGPVLGVRSDRRHHELRARPADLLLVAGARDRRRRRGRRRLRSDATGAVHRRARRRRVPQRPAAARVDGGDARRRDARHRISRTTCTHGSTRSSGCSRAFVGQARAVRRLGSAAIDLCYVAAGRMDGFWEQRPQAVGHRRRRADRRPRPAARVTNMDGAAFTSRGRRRPGQQRPHPRRDARRHRRARRRPSPADAAVGAIDADQGGRHLRRTLFRPNLASFCGIAPALPSGRVPAPEASVCACAARRGAKRSSMRRLACVCGPDARRPCAPVSGHAQQSFNLYVGGFVPDELQLLAVDDDVLVNNRLPGLRYPRLQRRYRGGEYLVGLGGTFWRPAWRRDLSAHGAERVPRLRSTSNGTEIEQDLKLRIVPFTATFRFLPLGHHNGVEPYIGGGVGDFNWRYSESGEFVDFTDGSIFRGTFVGERHRVGPVILGGVRFPVGAWSVRRRNSVAGCQGRPADAIRASPATRSIWAGSTISSRSASGSER